MNIFQQGKKSNYASRTGSLLISILIVCLVFMSTFCFIGTEYASAVTWHKIEYGNLTGYVSGDYVKVSGSTGTVTEPSGINVRSGPGTNYSVIGGLGYNATFKVITGGSSSSDSNAPSNGTTINKTGYVNSSGVRFRSKPDTSDSSNILYTLYDGDTLDVISKSGEWYYGKYKGKNGYIHSDYVTLNDGSSNTPPPSANQPADATFEEMISRFPTSYKPYLRALHKKYPNWKFVPQATGLKWSDVIYKETHPVYINLINNTSQFPDAYKSKAPEAFNSNGTYKVFDSGGFIAASEAAVKYYMDPRNFINEASIFQFYSMKYDSSTQTKKAVQAILTGTFMASGSVDGYASYADLLLAAGKASGANPLILASMIIQEQGANGKGGLINNSSGYYNHFSIGAYASGGRSAVTNGLNYAREAGWNTRAKSIIGGAKSFAKWYINAKQNTLYLKKFNVMNGLSNVGGHQYMGAVYGANSEASHTRTGYKNAGLLNMALVFEIPFYLNMPETTTPIPGTTAPAASKITKVRVSGADRVKTSIAAADTLKSAKNTSKFNNIVIASGNQYPDALSGSYLATYYSAPILLVTNSSISEVAQYAKKNLKSGGTVYILGGTSAVPSSMETALSGLKVKRVAGKNRYETNIEVLKACNVSNQDLLVCSGRNYPDALAAAASGKPILLVDSSLLNVQKNYLSTLKTKKHYLIGGPSAVTVAVENAIKSYGTVSRIQGTNRYDTATKVGKTFRGSSTTMVVANGKSFADGLSSAPLACALKAPIILANNGAYSNAKSYATSSKCKKMYIMGGTVAFPDSLASSIG